MLGGIHLTNPKTRDDSPSLGGMFFAPLKGMLIGIGITALLCLVFTAVALMGKDPDRLIGFFAYAALFVGSMTCGILAVKSDTQQRLFSGIIGVVGYVLVIWLLSLFFRDDAAEVLPPVWMAAGYLGCILTAFIGALIAKPKRTHIKDGSSTAAQMRRRLNKRV